MYYKIADKTCFIFLQCRERAFRRVFSLRYQWTSYQASLYLRAEMSNENEKEISVVDGDDEQNLDDKGE